MGGEKGLGVGGMKGKGKIDWLINWLLIKFIYLFSSFNLLFFSFITIYLGCVMSVCLPLVLHNNNKKKKATPFQRGMGPQQMDSSTSLQIYSQASAFHGTSAWSDRLFWFKLIKNKLSFPSRADILHMRMQEEQQFISSQGVTCIFNNSSSICWDVSCCALIKS